MPAHCLAHALLRFGGCQRCQRALLSFSRVAFVGAKGTPRKSRQTAMLEVVPCSARGSGGTG
eukprot:12340061-Alexandrium_andersonii.AAC.1